MKKLIIAGANGFMARYITRHFLALGWEVVGLARREEGLDKGCRYVHWDGESLQAWAAEVDGADALINLVGRSVNCRYTTKNKAEMMNSRVESTKLLAEVVRQCAQPPEVWLNSSTATIYRHAEDRPQGDEGEIGRGFSVEIAKAWERAFFEADTPAGVRKVALRTAMVMADEKGTVFDYLLSLAKCGLGGKVGSGQQMVSWIHAEDLCRSIEWLVNHPEIDGTVNLTAPDPLTNAELMRHFREAAGMPLGLPATRWMAEVGAFVLSTEAELVLKSRWVVPTRLQSHGFVFKHPEFNPAAWLKELWS